jgi:hypothetical protein
MQDDFWSLSGRKDWWDPEPTNKMFLGNFFIELGKIQFGKGWTGIKGKPCPKTSEHLKKVISQAAASGEIQTFVLNPKTLEYQPIGRPMWRNNRALAARFSRCMIDIAQPHKLAPSGEGHGFMYVDRVHADSYLKKMQTAPPMTRSTVKLDYLSTYVRYMISVAQSQKLDELNMPTKQALAYDLFNGWDKWRMAASGIKVLPKEAVLTRTMAENMASILRGEVERAAKSSGAGKK